MNTSRELVTNPYVGVFESPNLVAGLDEYFEEKTFNSEYNSIVEINPSADAIYDYGCELIEDDEKPSLSTDGENTYSSYFNEGNQLSYRLLESDQIADTYDLIKEKFNNELKKKSKYIVSNLRDVEMLCDALTNQIAVLKFKNIVVEITPSNAIKFKLKLDEETLLTITKPFEELIDLSHDEVIFNLYINNECILSDVKKLYDLVDALQQMETH